VSALGGDNRRRYEVAADCLEVSFEVKKSRFITRAYPAASRDEAMAGLAQAKLDYPDARHHCWAYLIGNPHSPTTVAMNDDGEPSGTAGKPILNVLQHKHIGDVMLVVIRYFGGIKLGAGGLVRAYSAAAQQAMEALPVKTVVPMEAIRLQGDYAFEQPLRHWLGGHDGRVDSVSYEGEVCFTVQLPHNSLADFEAFCAAHGARLLAGV